MSPETPTPLDAAVRDFLVAERAADPAEGASSQAAERALFGLFAALPEIDSGPGFTDAVLRRSGVLRRDLGWRARLATAAAYLLVIGGVLWLAPLATALLAHAELAAATAVIVDLFAFALARLGDLAAVAVRLADVGRILRLILTSPPGVIVSILCAASTLLTARWLAALLAAPRSSLHAVR